MCGQYRNTCTLTNSEPIIDWFPFTMRRTVRPPQTQGPAGGTARQRRCGIQANRKCPTPSVARPWGGGVGTVGKLVSGFGLDEEGFGGRGEAGGGDHGIRELPSQPSRIHSELRRAVPTRGNDPHGVRGIPSTRWGAGDASRNNQCSGRFSEPTCYCGPARRFSMANGTTCSDGGIKISPAS